MKSLLARNHESHEQLLALTPRLNSLLSIRIRLLAYVCFRPLHGRNAGFAAMEPCGKLWGVYS